MRAQTTISGGRVPLWRNVRVLAWVGQALFLLLVALVAAWLYGNVVSGMRRIGIGGGYDFMSQAAGFEIGVKPIPYTPQDSYWRAFLVGVLNTLSVTLIGIVLATVLGVIVGVAQLSSNWLVARLAQGYVAVFRNTPLLVQLFFWYLAVFLRMPRVQSAVALPGPIYLSNRGVAMVGLEGGATLGVWLLFVLGGALAGAGVWHALGWWQERTGRQSPRLLPALLTLALAAGAGWLVLGQAPLSVTLPERRGLNFRGGWQFVPEYAALLVGLVTYTGAFIAEIVRAGIQGVPKGQKEAALALGLSAGQSMRLIILPQALRIIIPPTTSQYLNLAKNSSLAIAIGFPDLFNVARTTMNQTGQVIQLIGLVMASYLAISLTTSLLMNLYNRRVRLVER
ncbi:MAG TPA: ABC transporter permease subunit [Roseiflexaceae bacterium]|nr:ABC transporter permease subunit [Roseiflexaceae bacterium]